MVRFVSPALGIGVNARCRANPLPSWAEIMGGRTIMSSGSVRAANPVPRPGIQPNACGRQGEGGGSVPARARTCISLWAPIFSFQTRSIRYVPYSPGMAKRIELTVSDEEFALIEKARGLVPRAAFIKAQLFTPIRWAPGVAEALEVSDQPGRLVERPVLDAVSPSDGRGKVSRPVVPVRYSPKRSVAPVPKKGK